VVKEIRKRLLTTESTEDTEKEKNKGTEIFNFVLSVSSVVKEDSSESTISVSGDQKIDRTALCRAVVAEILDDLIKNAAMIENLYRSKKRKLG
jgi:hypothetical protein